MTPPAPTAPILLETISTMRDAERVIEALWESNRELREALTKWVKFYDHLLDDLEEDDPLRKACIKFHSARAEVSRAAIAKSETQFQ